MCLTDRAEWLAARGQTAEAALLADEARLIFERLGARRWLQRELLAGGLSANGGRDFGREGLDLAE